MNLSAATLRVITLACLGTAIAVASYAASQAPSRVPERLGRRGRKRMTALVRSERWAAMEPIVRWLGVRVGGVLPDRLRYTLDRHLLHAGDYLGLTPEEYAALSVISGVVGGMVGLVFDVQNKLGGVGFALGVLYGGTIPYFQISSEIQERFQKINRGLPYAVDLISLCVGAGLDFPGAIRQVLEKSANYEDPLTEELSYLLYQLSIGLTRRQALVEFAERAPTEPVKEFVHTLVQAEERGNPVAEVLQIQSQVSRNRRSVRAEELAAKAGVGLMAPLGLIFLTILILILAPLILKVQATL